MTFTTKQSTQKSASGQMHRVSHIHFVGIGGAGMSGIAEVIANTGYQVSGSDLKESAMTRHLQSSGIEIQIGHRAENVSNADVVVVSTAIPIDNPELRAAREKRIPVVPRAEMLAELMRFRKGIAVAGTHGKTTTTSLLAAILAEAGMDPTFIIGGLVNAFGSHARLGQGEYLVAEADESDGSFLLLQPMMAVITNIDSDHLETYGGDFDNLRHAFLEFIHHLPFYGVSVLCIDDPEVKRIAGDVSRTTLTFGQDPEADIRAENIRQQGRQMSFDVRFPNQEGLLGITMNLPGTHNVRNALGAIAAAWEVGVKPEAMQFALQEFAGIGRRFEEVGELSIDKGSVTVLEDYGHHPTELAVTIEAARNGWPDRRLVVVFQPHRYSRTHELFDDFAQVLAEPDALVITDVYPAGEDLIPGADARSLCRAVRSRGRVDPVLIADVHSLSVQLPAILKDGDLVLLMGAGDIGTVASRLRSDCSFDKSGAGG
ncbi:MAG: UDP-N-acetylmuramate--L-alanine ligase [Proteobacteria bacterium]|nr:UDP-N-acetylmuramate--L-alanine ligase [Pseudomonadota bacterium]